MKNGFVTEDLDAEQLLTRRGRWQGQWPKSLRAHSPPPHPPPIRRRNQGKKKKQNELRDRNDETKLGLYLPATDREAGAGFGHPHARDRLPPGTGQTRRRVTRAPMRREGRLPSPPG